MFSLINITLVWRSSDARPRYSVATGIFSSFDPISCVVFAAFARDLKLKAEASEQVSLCATMESRFYANTGKTWSGKIATMKPAEYASPQTA